MAITINEVAVPDTVDGADAVDFSAATDVINEVEAHAIGSRDLRWGANEHLAEFTDPWEPRRLFLGRCDEAPVAMATYHLPREESSTSAWLTVNVLPEFRGRGIGSAFRDLLENMARQDGRTTVQSFAIHTAANTGESIPSPTGFGTVNSADPGARFLTTAGYRLAQVDRISRLGLPWESVDGADTTAQQGYSVERWVGQTPPAAREDLAALHSGMSTDAPVGDLEMPPEIWDASRVLNSDARLSAGGRTLLTVVVRHRASDSIVGFTQVSVPPDVDRAIFQGDTIVGRAHRGHRLGMTLKAAGLLWLSEVAPSHRCIYTWNAEENRHMLDVNEAVGFVAVGFDGAWRRDGV